MVMFNITDLVLLIYQSSPSRPAPVDGTQEAVTPAPQGGDQDKAWLILKWHNLDTK